jgi:hypothetical protein
MLSKKQKQAEGAALISQLNRDNLKSKAAREPLHRPKEAFSVSGIPSNLKRSKSNENRKEKCDKDEGDGDVEGAACNNLP